MSRVPKKVDIIIPVYNALPYLKRCVDSIFKNDAGYPFRLVLVNDASTDKEVELFLNSLKNKKVVILKNKKNLGFVGTCNKGLNYSKGDVVLLNQDTEVTKGWLKKIVECAYSSDKIATVSPFFNSGTGLFNIPDHYKNNPIPEGQTLRSWAETIEQISAKSYPEMLVNVGACFYIKRSVIKEIGILDMKTFGKGNGEEADFCLRAHRKGYIHVISDNTFILHEGARSFVEQPKISNQKQALIEKNTKIINSRYPEFQKWLDEFLLEDPLIKIHQNIWFHASFFSSKKRVLIFGNKKSTKLSSKILKKYSKYDIYLYKVDGRNLSVRKISSKNEQTLSLNLPEKLDIHEAAIKLIKPTILLLNRKKTKLQKRQEINGNDNELNTMRIEAIYQRYLKSMKFQGGVFSEIKSIVKKVSVATNKSIFHKPLGVSYRLVKRIISDLL